MSAEYKSPCLSFSISKDLYSLIRIRCTWAHYHNRGQSQEPYKKQNLRCARKKKKTGFRLFGIGLCQLKGTFCFFTICIIPPTPIYFPAVLFWFYSDSSKIIIKKWLMNTVAPTNYAWLRCQLPSLYHLSFWYLMNINMSPSSQ